MPPDKAEQYHKALLEVFRPIMKKTIDTELDECGSAIELCSGEGRLTKELFHNRFKTLECLDICDHKKFVKNLLIKNNVTRKVKFN